MIELGKQYRTEGGAGVVIYEIVNGIAFGRYGVIETGCPGAWDCRSHLPVMPSDICGSTAARLVEIRPRAIDRTEEWLIGKIENRPQVIGADVALGYYRELLDRVRQFKAEEDAS